VWCASRCAGGRSARDEASRVNKESVVYVEVLFQPGGTKKAKDVTMKKDVTPKREVDAPTR